MKDVVVGLFHPDNISLLPSPGSLIELLLVSHGFKTTVESALLETDDHEPEDKWQLLWVMYMVWKDGIAERRGIGQILETALEGAVGGNPCIKHVPPGRSCSDVQAYAMCSELHATQSNSANQRSHVSAK